jgi:hypothetical protein
VFGDESIDYAQALSQHYERGEVTDWQLTHVSAYATSHPWEDWAETWAHYLHMVDLLETAASYQTRVVVPGQDDEDNEEVVNPFGPQAEDFNQLVQQWVPVTLLLNSLNRSLGQDDAYPFALAGAALDKLRFVHEVIHEAASWEAPAEAMSRQPASVEPSAAATSSESTQG